MARRLASVPDPQRRAVLYVRVSALMGRSGETFHSPDLQLQAMRELARRRDLLEVEVVQDIDRSGRTFDREGADRILAMAGQGDLDVVVLYDLSRLGRNTGESLRYITRLRELGVSVVSCTEQIDDSPEGQFMLGQFLGMAQLYSDQIGRRWQQVAARRVEQGLAHGSVAPLGYVRQPGGELAVDEHVGPVVQEAFRRYAAGDLVSHITRDVGAQRGKATAIEVVKKVLANPVYIGKVTLHGQAYDGRHEPLVDEQTWERVQERLGRDSRTPSRRLAVSHSLVGLVFCAHCEYHLQLHSSPGREARGPRGGLARPAARVLQCRRAKAEMGNACRGPGIPHVEAVEAQVLQELRTYLRELRDQPGERSAKQARRTVARAAGERARRELAETEVALAQLTADRARRKVSETAYALAAADLEALIVQQQAAVDRAGTVAGSPTARESLRLGTALLELWDQGMTVPEQNRGLRLVVARVLVRRASSYREPEAARTTVEFL